MEFGVVMNRQDILNIVDIIDAKEKTEDMMLIKRLLVELVEKDDKEMDEYFNSLEYNYEDFLESVNMPLDYCSDDIPF